MFDQLSRIGEDLFGASAMKTMTSMVQGATAGAQTAATGQGGGKSDAMTDAFGHYAETAAKPSPSGNLTNEQLLDAAKPYGAETPASMGRLHMHEQEQREQDAFVDKYKSEHGGEAPGPNEVSAFKIGSRYNNGSTVDENAKVDLSSPESRLKFLSTFAQNNAGGVVDQEADRDESKCGATAMIGAMILAKGDQGVKDLVQAMEKGAPKGVSVIGVDLRKKIMAGEQLTVGDLNALKDSAYMHFNETVEHDDPESKDPKVTGINVSTMQSFIDENPSIKEAFKEHHMSMNHTDTDGDGVGNHYTVSLNDSHMDPSLVYDPLSRFAGPDAPYMAQQIIANPRYLEEYRNATRNRIIAHE